MYMSPLTDFLNTDPPALSGKKNLQYPYDEHDEYFDKQCELVRQEFPNCPFDISLPVSELKKLDQPLTEEKLIIITDSRPNCEYFGYPKGDPRRKTNYLYVKKGCKAISLRQVLHAMRKSSHYIQYAEALDDHIFLESFEKKSNVQYDTWFGS